MGDDSQSVTGKDAGMKYRNPNTGDTITLVQRQGSDLWEMRNAQGEWIGAADYLPNLQKKMERNWYERVGK